MSKIEPDDRPAETAKSECDYSRSYADLENGTVPCWEVTIDMSRVRCATNLAAAGLVVVVSQLVELGHRSSSLYAST